MAIEIEHKFLLASDQWRELVDSAIDYQQGYLSSEPTTSIRVRICADKAWLNIKSATIGNQRLEYEYEIPLTDGNEIMDKLCRKPLIKKTRHFVTIASHTWEIDEFCGDNLGLIIAEIELSDPEESFITPPWIGAEVTHDFRYYNNNLALDPYKNWKQN